jgi:hypothetical protein
MTFFLSFASSVTSVVYCFKANNNEGFYPVNVFAIKYATSTGCRKIFCKTACGLTFTGVKKPVITFAAEQ